MAETTELIKWDQTGHRLYETGVRKVVFYPYDEETESYTPGEAWNGVTSISESPTGGEASDLYADDSKYLSLYSTETLGASIEAYTYPEGFALCDGTAALATGVFVGQQPRKSFGLCYRTAVGNDVKGENFGYKLHLLYGVKASPSEKSYQTINDSPEAATLSWELTTTPVDTGDSDLRPTASLVIDTTKVPTAKQSAIGELEKILYGTPAGTSTEAVQARLPLPSEVLALFED